MAKISLNKLKLTPKDPVKIITWNEQSIEVKQYISIKDKLDLISEVLNAAASIDENRFYNPGKVDMFFVLKVIEYYTNISITDKQKENYTKLYDDFMSSGLYSMIFENILEEDVGYIYTLMKETIDQIYKYQNSVYGILDSLNNDYENLNLDISKLTNQLADKKDIELLNQVVTKLG